MNQVQKFESNLYKKYEIYKTHDKSTTTNKDLTDDQKELVESALNATFVNPKFKMKHFVTSGQITPYSTIKQFMLELKAIEESFENYELGIKKLGLEIEVAELKIAREPDLVIAKEMQIELEQKKHHWRQNQRRLQQLHIEREQFIELINEFNESPQGKLEDGRLLMSVVGTPEENYYEQEYWLIRLARQAAMDLSAYGRISAGNLDAIYQMPQDMVVQTLALAHEMNLKAEHLSNSLRGQVEQNLLQNDPQFKIEHQEEPTTPDQPGLLDAYRN